MTVDHANRLRTISQSAPPANHDIPVTPLSLNMSKMLTLPTPTTKGKAEDGNKVGGLWVDLAEDGSEDGTSTPVETEPGTLPPAPAQTEAGMIPPAPTQIEAGTTPEEPTGPKQMGTPMPDLPTAPSSESSSLGHDTEDE